MGFTPCESVFPAIRSPPELLNPLLIKSLTSGAGFLYFLSFEQKKGASRLAGKPQGAQDECRCSPINKTSPAETRASDAGHHDTPGLSSWRVFPEFREAESKAVARPRESGRDSGARAQLMERRLVSGPCCQRGGAPWVIFKRHRPPFPGSQG